MKGIVLKNCSWRTKEMLALESREDIELKLSC